MGKTVMFFQCWAPFDEQYSRCNICDKTVGFCTFHTDTQPCSDNRISKGRGHCSAGDHEVIALGSRKRRLHCCTFSRRSVCLRLSFLPSGGARQHVHPSEESEAQRVEQKLFFQDGEHLCLCKRMLRKDQTDCTSRVHFSQVESVHSAHHPLQARNSRTHVRVSWRHPRLQQASIALINVWRVHIANATFLLLIRLGPMSVQQTEKTQQRIHQRASQGRLDNMQRDPEEASTREETPRISSPRARKTPFSSTSQH